MRLYHNISRMVPAPLRDKLKSFLAYSSVGVNYDSFIGFVTLTSLLVALISGFFLGPLFNQSFWIFFLGALILVNAIVYFWLMLMVDKKARVVEDSLPDALQLMASNLRAGMTPEKALMLSARPEFGPLKFEIDMVGRKVTLGENIGMALMEMAKRIRSKRLLRAVELINSGLDSGGSLATLLDATSHDLREQFLVDKKIKASINMYIIFIFSAAALISPILFGLSSFLVQVLQGSFSQIDIPASAISSLGIQTAKSSLGSAFVNGFLLVFIAVNNLMAALLLGLIAHGKQREGLRFYVPMVALAIPIYLISKVIIQAGMGALFNI
jgi:archaeal flagellar protein FlaJ